MMIGRTISHYRVLSRLGKGGMGEVYRARDTLLQREVALKFLHDSPAIEGNGYPRVMLEARTAAGLDHENICTVHDVETSDRGLFIVMAFCEGRSLRDIIDDGPLEPVITLDIITQVAEGLGAAHRSGVIHRDVKPSNIMVSPSGKVKILDFGLARYSSVLSADASARAAGTVSYMPPEQIEGSSGDRRGDVWSLGVILYEMLAGRRPFEGEYEAAVMYAIVNQPHRPLSELVRGIPDGLGRIVDKALRKDPEERYGSMEEFISDLGAQPASSLLPMEEPEEESPVTGYQGTRTTALASVAASITLIALLTVSPWSVFRDYAGSGNAGEPLAGIAGDFPREKYDRSSFLFERGREIYESGDQSTGILFIRESLEIDPENVDALKTLAVFQNAAGDSRAAAAYIDRARKVCMMRGDTDGMLRCNYVEACVWHKWDMAIGVLEDLLELDPDDPAILQNMGYVYSRYLGDYGGAIESFERVFASDPDDSSGLHGTTWNHLGNALLYSGRYEEAMECYDRYEEIFPGSPDPSSSRAWACRFTGRYGEALDIYSRIAGSGNPAFVACEGMARTLLDIGRWREAADWFNRYLGAADLEAHRLNGHIELARLYLVQEEFGLVDREVEAALEAQPLSVRAHWIAGLRALRDGSGTEEASARLIRIRETMEEPFVFGGEPYYQHLRGLILLARGRERAAVEALEEAADSSPRDFFYFRRELSRLLLEAGRVEDALAAARTLMEYNPSDPELLMIMSLIHIRLGDLDEALYYRERVLEVLARSDRDFAPLARYRKEFETSLHGHVEPRS